MGRDFRLSVAFVSSTPLARFVTRRFREYNDRIACGEGVQRMTIRIDRRVLIAVVALLVVALTLGLGIFIGSGADQATTAVDPAMGNPAASQGSAGVQPVAPVNPVDAAAASGGVPIVRPEEAQQGIGKPNILFVDIRPADQYQQGHIPGALSLPYAEVAQRVTELPRDKSLVVYCDCRNDNDAANLASRLRPLGYADLWVLRGGWQGWKAANGPVE